MEKSYVIQSLIWAVAAVIVTSLFIIVMFKIASDNNNKSEALVKECIKQGGVWLPSTDTCTWSRRN